MIEGYGLVTIDEEHPQNVAYHNGYRTEYGTIE